MSLCFKEITRLNYVFVYINTSILLYSLRYHGRRGYSLPVNLPLLTS